MDDPRPLFCRNRLRDEGKQYPMSGCGSCGNGGPMGCPYNGPRAKLDAARAEGAATVDEGLLYRCTAFIEDQGAGEWAKDLVDKDARNLHDFVQKLAGERITASTSLAVIVEVEETVDDDASRWRAFGRKFRGLLISKGA